LNSVITILNNPKTEAYFELKNHILSYDFAWYWNSKSTNYDNKINSNYDLSEYVNIPFYSHGFLKRPEDTLNKIPNCNSQYVDYASNVFLEILEHNNIKVNSFLRINANCVHPLEKILNSVPHVDHNYEHKNIIIYLTDSGGCTVVKNESYEPKEDDIITFGGEIHYMQTPQKNRRVILLATFF